RRIPRADRHRGRHLRSAPHLALPGVPGLLLEPHRAGGAAGVLVDGGRGALAPLALPHPWALALVHSAAAVLAVPVVLRPSDLGQHLQPSAVCAGLRLQRELPRAWTPLDALPRARMLPGDVPDAPDVDRLRRAGGAVSPVPGTTPAPA